MRFGKLNIHPSHFLVMALALTTPALAQHAPNPCTGLPAAVCSQVLRQNQGFANQDLMRLHYILDFTKDKPGLRDHLLGLLKDPQGDDVMPVGDGNFFVTVPTNAPCPPGIQCGPQHQTIVTHGMSTKLSGMFRGAVFAGDRNLQLMLYGQAYSHLPPGFNINGVYPPNPASLTFADLTTIGEALAFIGNAWQFILPNLPPPNTPPSTADCNGEAGTTPQHQLYGDRTQNSTSCTPSSSGLYGTLPDDKFPLRKYLTCVKEQGARGTCHAFADTSAFELMISMNHGVKANFSEQDLMEHYRTLWTPGYEHESGDAFEELTGAINNNYFFAYEYRWDYNPSYGRGFNDTTGVYFNSCQNFPNTEPGCSDSAPQAPGICVGINFLGIPLPLCSLHDAGIPESKYRPTLLTRFWNSNDTELSKEYMILSVAFNNAVVLGFNVTPAFENVASNGYVVYNADDVTINKGGHYVHVVGIAGNDELPDGAPQAHGGGYFIVKNSWSNCFADSGYLYLDFDYVKAVGWDGFSVSSVN